MAVKQRPVRLPLGVILSYLVFPWVLFLPFILSCSPNVSYSGYGQYVRFEPYPSVRLPLLDAHRRALTPKPTGHHWPRAHRSRVLGRDWRVVRQTAL